MQDTKQRFVIDDPASYRGTSFKYHVGCVISGKNGVSHNSITLYLSIEIQTSEDLEYLTKRLLEISKKKDPKVDKLLIMGFNRLYD